MKSGEFQFILFGEHRNTWNIPKFSYRHNYRRKHFLKCVEIKVKLAFITLGNNFELSLIQNFNMLPEQKKNQIEIKI